jgi:tetratricopeptide (TPR) repeat protein
MRNHILSARTLAAALLLIVGAAGCTENKPSAQQSTQLTSGFKALDEQQSAVAIDRADEYLREQPHGPGSAEALYLKGRGYEQKAAADPSEIKRNLTEARTAYMEALNQQPSPKTEGYIRASLSNVAFFQDDYSTALGEASRAYNLVDSPNIQSVLLYRTGVSQQRLGRFTDADRTFEQVQQRYPGSPIADRAREHQGQRNFFVQLATFNSPAGADKAIQSLQNSGVVVSKRSDQSGHTLVDAGPFSTYESARDAKARFAGQYPDALVVP